MVDLVIDRDVELVAVVDELCTPSGRLAVGDRRRVVDGFGRRDDCRGQRVLSGGLAAAAALSSAHAQQRAGSL